MGSGQLSQVMSQVSKWVSRYHLANLHNDAFSGRDPSQHSALKEEIEEQSTALYATARLWDDGIIKPTDTRDVVGLGLSLAKKQRLSGRSNTWDGSRNGFGVFRM